MLVTLLAPLTARLVLNADTDEQVGVDIVRRALEEPIRIIAANAGAEGAIVVTSGKKRRLSLE